MARRIGYNGQLIIDELKDLKRGDQVYITYWAGKYIPATVTRVKTVECATIITIRKIDKLECVRFVGYHTEKVAMNRKNIMLTLDKYWGDCIQETLEKADRRSEAIVDRANALIALQTLKTWLFDKDKTFEDREVE